LIQKGTLILVFILAGSNLISAQDTLYVNPKSNLIDGSFIQPYTNKWQVSVVDENGNKSTVRIWTDYAQILEIESEDYLHRVQDLYSPNMELQETWINVVVKENLLPRRFASQ